MTSASLQTARVRDAAQRSGTSTREPAKRAQRLNEWYGEEMLVTSSSRTWQGLLKVCFARSQIVARLDWKDSTKASGRLEVESTVDGNWRGGRLSSKAATPMYQPGRSTPSLRSRAFY